MIAIIDYDAGNLKSVAKALHYLGGEAVITRDIPTILRADHVILPGVGSFGVAMDQLKKYGLDQAIYEVVAKKTPFLGICLGLQLLFEGSEESEGIEGLGILHGRIVKIPAKDGLKIPHIGWNSLRYPNEGAQDADIVKAVTEYGTRIHASVEQSHVFACQFHPEKSSSVGLMMLKNFMKVQKGV